MRTTRCPGPLLGLAALLTRWWATAWEMAPPLHWLRAAEFTLFFREKGLGRHALPGLCPVAG